jgi:flagellar biogenesis protein FliO
MKAYQIVLLILTILSTSAMARVEIKGLDFKKNSNRGTIVIHYSGELNNSFPELEIIGKVIQVSLPGAKVKSTIEKSVSFSSKIKDTMLRAYQTNKTSSKVKAMFPFNMEKRKSQVNLSLKDNKIILDFPRVAVKLQKAPKYGSILKVNKAKKIKKDFLNEDYLNKLLTINSKKPVKKKKLADAKKVFNKLAKKNQDSVNTTLASPVREPEKSGKQAFSLLEYGGKFVAFLGVVLLLFYGVMTLLKKGFLKKGKLGFLNNADQVSVLSQTYIAPKKSLMLIKAHNQVFLVSNTDAGIHPISEIADAAGLIKGGEKSISGHNFDTKLTLASDDETNDDKIKIKEDISLSNQKSSISSYEEVKEKVSFSDQLKKKVKGLKPLH